MNFPTSNIPIKKIKREDLALSLRHPLLIPQGDFCYSVLPIDDSVEVDPQSPRLGRDIRQASFGGDSKMVLCPYWVLTDHGTVRCEHCHEEVLSLEKSALAKAEAHFGTTDISKLETLSDLADKLKICDIRRERNHPSSSVKLD